MTIIGFARYNTIFIIKRYIFVNSDATVTNATKYLIQNVKKLLKRRLLGDVIFLCDGVLNYAASHIKRDHLTITWRGAVKISKKGESEKYKYYSIMVFKISTFNFNVFKILKGS